MGSALDEASKGFDGGAPPIPCLPEALGVAVEGPGCIVQEGLEALKVDFAVLRRPTQDLLAVRRQVVAHLRERRKRSGRGSTRRCAAR